MWSTLCTPCKVLSCLGNPHPHRIPQHLHRTPTPCYYNVQLDSFNSRFACPGTEAVDVFTVHWGDENNWMCPPPGLVVRVITHAEVCNAWGTLGCVMLEVCILWPLLCPDSESFAPHVAAVYCMSCHYCRDCFNKGGWVVCFLVGTSQTHLCYNVVLRLCSSCIGIILLCLKGAMTWWQDIDGW